MKESRIHKFVGDQLSRWPLACDNFRALKNVRVREVEVGGLKVKLLVANASYAGKTVRQSR